MDKLKTNSPALWEYIHKSISRVYGEENVIIAGGCVRDYALGGEKIIAKDIDIFVNVDSEMDLEFGLLDLDPGHWVRPTIRVDQKFSDEDVIPEARYEFVDTSKGDEHINGLIAVADAVFSADGTDLFDRHEDVNNYFYYAVNIMANPLEEFTGSNLVSRFDHSLCFGWYHPAHGMVLENPLKRTMETKNIEIINENERTKNRIKRMLKRYPEFNCEKYPRPAPAKTKMIKGKTYYTNFKDPISTTNIQIFDLNWNQLLNGPQGDAAQGLPNL